MWHPAAVSADAHLQEAVRAFKERHSHLAGAGLRAIELGEPYLLAKVDRGFARDRLPAVFMGLPGLPVVLDDGAYTYEATGERL
jgi:hypothetical protein